MKADEYYTEEQWHRALATFEGGFQIISKEYNPRKFGRINSICCNVLQQYDHYLPGTEIKETAPVKVSWRHDGKCYKPGRNRFEAFDLCKTLKAIAKEDAKLAKQSNPSSK